MNYDEARFLAVLDKLQDRGYRIRCIDSLISRFRRGKFGSATFDIDVNEAARDNVILSKEDKLK